MRTTVTVKSLRDLRAVAALWDKESFECRLAKILGTTKFNGKTKVEIYQLPDILPREEFNFLLKHYKDIHEFAKSVGDGEFNPYSNYIRLL